MASELCSWARHAPTPQTAPPRGRMRWRSWTIAAARRRGAKCQSACGGGFSPCHPGERRQRARVVVGGGRVGRPSGGWSAAQKRSSRADDVRVLHAVGHLGRLDQRTAADGAPLPKRSALVRQLRASQPSSGQRGCARRSRRPTRCARQPRARRTPAPRAPRPRSYRPTTPPTAGASARRRVARAMRRGRRARRASEHPAIESRTCGRVSARGAGHADGDARRRHAAGRRQHQLDRGFAQRWVVGAVAATRVALRPGVLTPSRRTTFRPAQQAHGTASPRGGFGCRACCSVGAGTRRNQGCSTSVAGSRRPGQMTVTSVLPPRFAAPPLPGRRRATVHRRASRAPRRRQLVRAVAHLPQPGVALVEVRLQHLGPPFQVMREGARKRRAFPPAEPTDRLRAVAYAPRQRVAQPTLRIASKVPAATVSSM